MRKALVIACILAVGLGGAAAAGPLSGSWSMWAESDSPQTLPFKAFESVLNVNYTLGGWSFGATAVSDKTGFENLFFEAKGALSLFAFRSILDFDAQTPSCRAFLSAVHFTFAGLDLHGIAMLDNVGTAANPLFGLGLLLGGSGVAGDLSFWAQARFNVPDPSANFYIYGYDWMLDHFIFNRCGTWYKPSALLDVQTAGCSLAWGGVDIYVKGPFACFDLLTVLSISCANGFDFAKFEIDNIQLGIPWLALNWVDILFTTTTKSVNTVFSLTLDKTLCFTPYWALDGAGTSIGGISLKALLLNYTWDGVTFKAGHLFDEDGWQPYLNYPGYDLVYGWAWDGTLTYYAECKVPQGYDEFFGIEVDGDTCCGGSFKTSIFWWFDTGHSTGLFDIDEVRATLEAGLGSNVTLQGGVAFKTAGLNWLRFGGRFSW